MTAIIIIDAETGTEVHRIDTSNQNERQRELTFMGVLRKTDLDRFVVREEEA